MTMNVLLGHPTVHPRSDGRCQRDADSKPGHAFSDLVKGSDPKHGKADRVRARDADAGDDGGRPIDYHAMRLEVRSALAVDETAEPAADTALDVVPAEDAGPAGPAVEEVPDAEPQATEQATFPVPTQPAVLPVAEDDLPARAAHAEDAGDAGDGRPTAAPDRGPARTLDDRGNRPSKPETPARSVVARGTGQVLAEPVPGDDHAEGWRAPPGEGTAGRAARPVGERPVQTAVAQPSAALDGDGEARRDGGAKPAVSAPAAEASRPAASATSDAQPARPNQFAGQNAAPFAGKVNVLGFSAAAAPAPVAMLGTTSAGLVAAIEADPTWRAAAAEPAPGTFRTPNFASGVNTLRIQLHPAELGMVTARLTAVGSQLEIEIRVESNDARQRLANDSDAIVKALRAAGLDVERVTIQQGSASSTSANQSGSGAREQNLAGQQMQSDGHGRDRGNRQPGAGDGEDAAAGPPADLAAHRARGDVYI